MRIVLVVLTCSPLVAGRCYGQAEEPVPVIMAKAFANLRSGDPEQFAAGLVRISSLVESGRVVLRHAEGRVLLDSLLAMAVYDPNDRASGIAFQLAADMTASAGPPPLIDEPRWLWVYRSRPERRLGVLRWFARGLPGAGSLEAYGEMAIVSQNDRSELPWVVEFLFDRHGRAAGTAELRRVLDANLITNPEARMFLQFVYGGAISSHSPGSNARHR